MSEHSGLPSPLWLEFASASGYSWAKRRTAGGLGVILRLVHVRPASTHRFQPMAAQTITPRQLDRLVGALKRWRYDIVPMDEVVRRLHASSSGRRFVALTFDGGTRDLCEFAQPVLARHDVPFTVYAPTSFADGLGDMWWLVLEQIVARNDRISLIMDGRERHFPTGDIAEKIALFGLIHEWLAGLSPHDLGFAMGDLAGRYRIDRAAIARAAAPSWEEMARLASDPCVTIGSATVNYQRLSTCDATLANREIRMGKAVIEAAFSKKARHFAYPHGEMGSFGRRDVLSVSALGFDSAVTAEPGMVTVGVDPLMLPRLSWDASRMSLRALHALISGVGLPAPARRDATSS